MRQTTMLLEALCLAFGISGISAQGGPSGIKNLVTFGDSYTDEGRLGYFIANNGAAPPAGTIIPRSNATASGGYTWPYFASEALGGVATYNYAVSGAMCSNEIISRYLDAVGTAFPSVKEYEVPAFLADLELFESNSTTNVSFSADTVYTMWIGTNDLGKDGFLTDQQKVGLTIQDYIECVWDAFDRLYDEAGARRFVLFNQAPLEQSPLYASVENGGIGDGDYWSNKTAYNATEYEQKMLEYTTLVNTIDAYGAPFQKLVAGRWPDAEISVFDVHQLMKDIRASPDEYLDAPADAVGYYHSSVCDAAGTCTDSPNPLSSFLWYDPLHPSERADAIIALEFVNVLNGNSTYGVTY